MPPLADPAAAFAAARVARLATLRPDGSPRLVPVTFTVVDGLICSAVDAVKPKRHRQLARLADIEREPRVALLVDEYDEDWTQLWWARIDGLAAVRAVDGAAAAALAAKYPAYRATDLMGAPMVVVTPCRWTGWTAGAGT